MDTLEYWEERLAVLPTTIDCSEMHILGEDRQAPVFAGPGHIDIKSENDIDFTMYGTSTDGSDAIQRLCRAYENPYQVADQFVLEATDYRGTQWNCGWTHPEYKDSTGSSYLLMGTVNSLVTLARGHAVSKTSSIELIFPPDLWMPMDKTMVSVSSIDGAEVAREYRPGQQAVNVLDSEIKFFYRPPSNSLWLTAATSDTLVHPYAESWVCEPLRILLGQLVYPRLVARNFGDGTAHVWLRRSARLFSGLGIASLLSDDPDMRRCFWELYARLLQLIAKPKIASSLASLELHPITRF
ncbi:MAG TPA: hypothetical protein PKH07_20485, partial [bacterium]|nr:hypothetical protein [bacterium]